AREADRARAWCLAAAGAAVAAGLLVAGTGLSVASYWEDPSVLLRLKDLGAGLLPSVLVGAAIAVAGGLAFDRRRRALMLGSVLAVALPAGFLRLQEREELVYWCGGDCVSEAPGGDWFTLAGPLLLALAALCAVALGQAGAWTRTQWAPTRLVILTIGAVVVWIASRAINIYDLDGAVYGDTFSTHTESGILWPLLGAMAVVCVALAALAVLDRDAGTGALVGVATLAAIAVVNELAYLGGVHESPTGSARLWYMVIPALAVVGLVVVVAVQSRRPEPAPTPDG
ncbi:MAG: hypothetical protein ACRD0A_20590, partial [Acidimicrobiales bacterium]